MTSRVLAPPEADRFWSEAEVVLAPDDPRPGAWVGAPSAQLVEGVWWLAYRMRRPIGEGRGFANVVAHSDDGVRFDPVVGLGREAFGAESLERPALVHTHDGRWRLYVSCATPGSTHWWVDLLEGTTEHATSDDGVNWAWQGTALAGTPGTWDARATAEENGEERTGLARRRPDGGFAAEAGGPLLESPNPPAGLRYADAVPLPDGTVRWFCEATRADSAHELRTVLLPG